MPILQEDGLVQMIIKHCFECKKEFQSGSNGRKYCDTCRGIVGYRNIRVREEIIKIMGKTISPEEKMKLREEAVEIAIKKLKKEGLMK